ncbi:MAG TPA: oligosaccharide flippase family protein [Oscillatoriaceae cyanobacterium]
MSATRVAKHTFFNFLTIGFNAVSSLVVTALIARRLEPSGMGTYSLVTWFFTMAGILVNLGLVTTTMKYMAEALGRDDRAEAGAVLAYGVKQLLRNGLAVTVVWLVVSPMMGHFYPHPHLSNYMLVASLAIIPMSMMALLTAACQGLQRYDRVALMTGVYTAIMFFGTLTVLALHASIPGLLMVIALASLSACLGYWHFLGGWQSGWLRSELALGRKRVFRRYSNSLMVLILLDSIVWQRSGVFFLGMWAPAKAVAFYALAFALATTAMRLVPGTLVGLLIPSMSRSFGSGDLRQVSTIYHTAGRWMALLALPVAVGGSVLASSVVSAMYGDAYGPAATLLAVLFGSGALVMCFGFPASSVLYAIEGQGFLVLTGMGVGLLNIVLSILLIPRFGALGAAWASAAGQVAALVPGAYFAGKQLGGVWPDTRRFPATLAAALVMGIPVWAIAHALPHWQALGVGIPVGALVYAFNLWLFRALAPEDWARIRQVAARVPVLKRFAAPLAGLAP